MMTGVREASDLRRPGKRQIRYLLPALVLTSALAVRGQIPPPTNAVHPLLPPLRKPSTAITAPSPSRIPGTWLDKDRGYEEALEIQRAVGVDLFVYFSRDDSDNEKGLCRWFEKKSLEDPVVQRLLRQYIKVRIPLGSKKACDEIGRSFEVRRCPAIFVVQPNGRRQPCRVFNWPDGKPEPVPPADLVELIRARSSAPSAAAPAD
jgi:hypothetical protein